MFEAVLRRAVEAEAAFAFGASMALHQAFTWPTCSRSPPTTTISLFLRAVVYRVAPADPRLLRAVVRRVDLLDPPDRLEQDRELQSLALELYRSAPRPAGPSRSQMLEALTA